MPYPGAFRLAFRPFHPLHSLSTQRPSLHTDNGVGWGRSFIKLYLLLLFTRVLLTWFPNVNWMGQPWITLRQVSPPAIPRGNLPSHPRPG
jgi:hypothetical protein